MLELPDVTVLCADTANHALALRALERSRNGIHFARALLLTDALPAHLEPPAEIDVATIAPLRSRDDYSRLMLKGLLDHVHTAHVLVVQWDGYAVNPQAWDPAFLDCDYLGARWFWFDDAHKVGNGGFSLRSRRLLDALQDPRITLVEAEDITIGRAFRPLLEEAHGIRFGSDALADRFAFEAAYPIGSPFGFHGLFNFARVVPQAEIVSLAPHFSDAIARSPQLAQLLRNCAALGQWPAVVALAERRLQVVPDDTQALSLLEQARASVARGLKAGRNDPCPCGSGKRYKQCHGALGMRAHADPGDSAGAGAAGTAAASDRGVAGPRADASPSPPASGELQGRADDPLPIIRRGLAAHGRGEVDAAERDYRIALRLQPDHPLALHYLGVLEYQRERLDVALPLLERSTAAVPGEAEFHNNLGLALAAADRLDEAIASYRRALALRHDHAIAWNNLGLAHAAANAADDAVDAYDRALTLEPGFAQAHWNRALALLARGDFVEGWREYEWRLKVPAFRPVEDPPAIPRWDGAPLHGRRILLVAEQGLGDTVQFIRHARALAQSGGYVIARVPDKLAALIATVPGVAAVSVRGAQWPRADVQVPLMSLPGALDIVPVAASGFVPYLAVDARQREAARIAIHERAGGRRAIGLAWTGAQRNTNDRRRSIALARLAPLLSREDIAWFSLQHDDDAEVAVTPAAARLNRMDERIAFDGMAAMIDVLDAVVTVDTSVGHVAGALGKPVSILLPFASDWRWGIGTSSSPWYPSARLFRQARPGDWHGVVEAVAGALDDEAAP
jgi:tetratricopeptide (TPR) repeat protein